MKNFWWFFAVGLTFASFNHASSLYSVFDPRPYSLSVLWGGWGERKRERPFYFFDCCYFYRDTQREPRRRREQALCMSVTYPRRTARRLARTTWPEMHWPKAIENEAQGLQSMSILVIRGNRRDSFKKIVSGIGSCPRTYKEGLWVPPFSKVFLIFFPENQTSAPNVFSSCLLSFARIFRQVW